METKNNNGLNLNELEEVSGGGIVNSYKHVSRNDPACDMYSPRNDVPHEEAKCKDCRACKPGSSGFFCVNRYN